MMEASRRSFAGATLAAALLRAGGMLAAPSPRPPKIFSYPAPYQRGDGAIMLSPIAIDPTSFTTRFPAIRELDGIVLMPLWSSLNPAPGRFDFTLIEQALDFWSPRRRSVVLGAVTFGYPVMTEAGRMQHPVPSWVLERTRNFVQSVPVLGPVRPLLINRRDVAFPFYWDPFFQQTQAALIEALGRFDGHPALWSVRICTGITGEDNPTFDGLRDAMSGFSNAHWIGYTRAVVGRYRATFHQSTLEFDVDRLGFIKALGTASDRALADGLIHDIDVDRIFFAMNGLDPPNVAAWRNGTSNGPACSLRYVQEVRRRGGRVGVEGGGLNSLSMADVDTLAAACRLIGPERLVIFPDALAALDRRRYGPSTANALSEAVFGPACMSSLADKGLRLMEGIGV